MAGGTPCVIPSCHSNKALQPVGPTEQRSAVHGENTRISAFPENRVALWDQEEAAEMTDLADSGKGF